eukprot:2299688-Rhodomonas_salina.1
MCIRDSVEVTTKGWPVVLVALVADVSAGTTSATIVLRTCYALCGTAVLYCYRCLVLRQAILLPGDELLVDYGDEYWRQQRLRRPQLGSLQVAPYAPMPGAGMAIFLRAQFAMPGTGMAMSVRTQHVMPGTDVGVWRYQARVKEMRAALKAMEEAGREEEGAERERERLDGAAKGEEHGEEGEGRASGGGEGEREEEREKEGAVRDSPEGGREGTRGEAAKTGAGAEGEGEKEGEREGKREGKRTWV